MILVCGHDELTGLVLETLKAFGQKIVLVGPAPSSGIPSSVPLVAGAIDQASTWIEAGIKQAKAILLLNNDDRANFQLALLLRQLNGQVRIISRLHNQNLGRYFDQHIPRHFSLSVSALVAPAFALKAVSDEFLGYFALPTFSRSHIQPPSHPRQPDEVLREERSLWNVVDLKIGSGSRLLRLSLEELETQFQARILFHYPLDQLSDFSTSRLFEDFDPRALLGEGDRVVLICPPQHYIELLERNGAGVSRAQRWAAGQAQASARSQPLWQTWLPTFAAWLQWLQTWPRRMSPLVRFLSATLGGMVILSTANFLSIGKSLPDALFLTVTVLTGGYGDIDEFKDPETSVFVKLIASILTICGAALVGFVYGVVTDKLLSSRIGLGAAAVIPKADHVVVAGLGHVGFRIVQLLKQMGYDVVAIEQNHDNPFIESARQDGIPVVIGDSAALGILQQVNIATARSLIGATDRDLGNLETALTGMALNPKLRTVLRLLNPDLASQIQEHFRQLDSSYSLVSLAAPAFATAALVGTVYGTMVWEQQTLLVTALEIGDPSPLAQLSLAEVVHRYDLLPLIVQPGKPGSETVFFPSWRDESRQSVLQPGDRVFVLATPDSLSRLAKQQPLPPEAYRVKVMQIQNAYFTNDIVDAIAFYARIPHAMIRNCLQHLPAIVTPQISRERALKLARHLRKMGVEVAVLAEVAHGQASETTA
ncbi:MAG: NAD-binding protein [Thermostichales cyanobacterium SRBZ-1_bins_19]